MGYWLGSYQRREPRPFIELLLQVLQNSVSGSAGRLINQLTFGASSLPVTYKRRSGDCALSVRSCSVIGIC